MVRNRRFTKRNALHSRYTKQKERNSNTGNFGRYCNRLLNFSFVPGCPGIAASRITLRRAIKATVSLVCVAGFLYQTYYFLQIYMEYPTITDINVINPETIEAPAVTICNRNRMRRTVLCEKYPSSCMWPETEKDKKDFCKNYQRYCPGEEMPTFYGMVGVRLYTDLNKSFALLEELGLKEETELIRMCIIETHKLEWCSDYHRLHAVDSYGYLNTCFTLQSLWGKPDQSPKNLPVSSAYKMELDMHPEDYLSFSEMVQAFIYVHDPRRLVNPLVEEISLAAGFGYKLYVRMEYRKRLPLPFKTQCTDYRKSWRENGGYGPITKRDCTDLCKIEAFLDKFQCVGIIIKYPHNHTICEDRTITISDEVNDMCSRICKDPCIDQTYSVNVEVQSDLSLRCHNKTDEHCMLKNIIIEVDFTRMVISEYLDEPKFQSVEIFSYIGGYMGMWLGISLVALFDFIEMMGDVLIYPLLKWKRKKKDLNRISHMQKNKMFNMYDI